MAREEGREGGAAPNGGHGRWAAAAALAGLLVAGAAAGDRSPLARHADANTVVIVTRNEDGTPRETKIWLVVVGGRAFVRTGSSRWGRNAERDPRVRLRVEGEEVALRARPVEEPELRRRVEEAFREKYGFSDWLVGLLRGHHPRIFELLPRDG